ncbi:hypothetical protein [Nocardia sp. NPDC049149]|uniref:hypothetical protein n=1 Tax=Nocardia sp. NPDC049149 TaxID=3364315 RepID=UPI00371E3955
MSEFGQLRQRVLSLAGKAGYGLVRQNHAPYGWELFTASRHKPVVSGTLAELDQWLREQQTR